MWYDYWKLAMPVFAGVGVIVLLVILITTLYEITEFGFSNKYRVYGENKAENFFCTYFSIFAFGPVFCFFKNEDHRKHWEEIFYKRRTNYIHIGKWRIIIGFMYPKWLYPVFQYKRWKNSRSIKDELRDRETNTDSSA